MPLTTQEADWIEAQLEQMRDCGADEEDIEAAKAELLDKLQRRRA